MWRCKRNFRPIGDESFYNSNEGHEIIAHVFERRHIIMRKAEDDR
jgi:hypothetical protein